MNKVNKTLYIPLYAKAYVSRRGLFLQDEKAEEIWAKQSFPLKGRAKSKWLAYYLGIRAAVFDDWAKRQMTDEPGAVMIHIGCGLDGRAARIGTMGHKWYDVDFPEVLAERRRYYAESDGYRMLAGDAAESEWLNGIPETRHAVVLMEGVSMYLSAQKLTQLTANLAEHFEQFSLLMDCYTVMAAKMSGYRNPINDVGVTEVFGMDDPMAPTNERLVFVKEHNMMPRQYIDELSGFEKFIFEKLYAGGFAKKLYRLFEYRTV